MPPDTTVIGPDGPVPFGDVFEGRDELVVYSHMFYDGKPWEWQGEGCTRNTWNMGDAADAAYLNANGITFAILGDGPYEEIAAFRDFMGYTAPWYSIAHLDHPTVGVAGRISCYLRRQDKIYLTYWTTGRGDEVMSPSFGLLDMTAYGRREEWEDSPEGWPHFPTHSVLRTDEHGEPMGPRNGRSTGAPVDAPGRHTLARHLSNIFTKLGVASRATATAYACVHGLYFVGLHFLFSMSSETIGGVKRDAERIVKHLAQGPPKGSSAEPSRARVLDRPLAR